MSGDPFVRDAMLAAVPSLRAFAISLSANVDRADDLVQETLLRAWANIDSFEPGTNMSAWLFTILRNLFRSEYRKRRREIAGRLGGYRRLGPAQLTALINRDNALVVDLRPIADFDKGHIAGSKNVQMSQFDPENKQLAPARALPVVLVCKAGESAVGAAKRLRKAGFGNVSLLEGGIQAWQAADLPLVKGRG